MPALRQVDFLCARRSDRCTMIDKVVITSFKNHLGTEIDLGRFTLLVGPNAAGKSSALEAIHLLSRVTQEPVVDLFRGETDLGATLRPTESTLAVSFEGEGRLHQNQRREGVTPFSLKLSAHTNDRFPDGAAPSGGRRLHKTALRWKWEDERDVQENPNVAPGDFLTTGITQGVRPASLLRLEGRYLAKALYSERSPARMTARGEGLVNVLAEKLLEADGSFDCIIEDLKQIVPAVTGVRVRRRPVEQDITVSEDVNGPYPRRLIESRVINGEELLFDFTHADGIPASLVSEGTLIALGILTAIHTEEGTSLVLLDDIDKGLHPRAQADLIGIIKRLLEEKSDLQIVATSHSPYLIDAVDPEDVWVLAIDDDGVPACARLTDHPRATKALEVLMAGEFYSSEDERWVVKGRIGSDE